MNQHYILFNLYPVFPIWSECSWNNTPKLQSFTGHFGYAVLGSFIKIHLDPKEKFNLYRLGFLLVSFGLAITAIVWTREYCYLKIKGPNIIIGISQDFGSINVAMMACGIFLLLRKIQCNNQKVVCFVQDIALKSYGMYLDHMIILDQFHKLFDLDSKKP